jgi:hypothetical protein
VKSVAVAVAALVVAVVAMVVADKLVLTTRVAAPEVRVVVASVVDISSPGAEVKTFAVETLGVTTMVALVAMAAVVALVAVLTTNQVV